MENLICKSKKKKKEITKHPEERKCKYQEFIFSVNVIIIISRKYSLAGLLISKIETLFLKVYHPWYYFA